MNPSAQRNPSLIHLHILLVLAEGDRHGYGIKQEVERRTDGEVRLGPGTLYEAIQRLENAGWIEEARPPRGLDGRPRRHYRLTKQGWSVLEGEVARLRDLLNRAMALPRLRKAASA